MIKPGQIALAPFPYTDLSNAKKRPVLLLKALEHKDFLVCMVSSKTNQINPELDMVITPQDEIFLRSGLKTLSVIRLSRLAVLDSKILLGSIGSLPDNTTKALQLKLSKWLTAD